MQVDTLTERKTIERKEVPPHQSGRLRYVHQDLTTDTFQEARMACTVTHIRQIFMCVLCPRSRRYCRFVMYTLKWGHSITDPRGKGKGPSNSGRIDYQHGARYGIARFVKRYFIVTVIMPVLRQRNQRWPILRVHHMATGKHRPIIQTDGQPDHGMHNAYRVNTKRREAIWLEAKDKPLTCGVYETVRGKLCRLSKTWIPI